MFTGENVHTNAKGGLIFTDNSLKKKEEETFDKNTYFKFGLNIFILFFIII